MPASNSRWEEVDKANSYGTRKFRVILGYCKANVQGNVQMLCRPVFSPSWCVLRFVIRRVW